MAASLPYIRYFRVAVSAILNPVQAQSFGEHNGLQVLVFLLLLKPLLLQECHKVVPLLHHLQHLVQDLLLLGQLLLRLQVIWGGGTSECQGEMGGEQLVKLWQYSPSTAILSLSSCCSRLCRSSSSSSRALGDRKRTHSFIQLQGTAEVTLSEWKKREMNNESDF